MLYRGAWSQQALHGAGICSVRQLQNPGQEQSLPLPGPSARPPRHLAVPSGRLGPPQLSARGCKVTLSLAVRTDSTQSRSPAYHKAMLFIKQAT